MKPRTLLLLLISTGLLITASTGCANSPNSEEYYRRGGTVSRGDPYPPRYRHSGGYYGRPGYYRHRY